MTSKLLKGKPDLNYSPMNLLPLISQCNCYINLDSSFTFLAILHSLSNSSDQSTDICWCLLSARPAAGPWGHDDSHSLSAQTSSRGIFLPGASWSLLAQSLAKTESGRVPSQHVGQQSEIRKVMDFPPWRYGWGILIKKKKTKNSPLQAK